MYETNVTRCYSPVERRASNVIQLSSGPASSPLGNEKNVLVYILFWVGKQNLFSRYTKKRKEKLFDLLLVLRGWMGGDLVLQPTDRLWQTILGLRQTGWICRGILLWILNTMIPHFSQSDVLSPHVIAVHAACLVKNNSLDYAITHKSLQQRDHFLSRLSSGQVWGCLIMNNNSTYIETSYKDKPELLSLCVCRSVKPNTR